MGRWKWENRLREDVGVGEKGKRGEVFTPIPLHPNSNLQPKPRAWIMSVISDTLDFFSLSFDVISITKGEARKMLVPISRLGRREQVAEDREGPGDGWWDGGAAFLGRRRGNWGGRS